MTSLHWWPHNHAPHSVMTLLDLSEPIIAAWRGMGYQVTTGPRLSKDAINLIPECWAMHNYGTLLDYELPFAILCTEWYDEQGLNSGHNSYWQDRSKAFERVVEKAQFVWTIVDAPYYHTIPLRYNVGTAFLELGYEPSYAESKHNIPPSTDYSKFSAFGTHSDERSNLRDRIRASGAKINWGHGIIDRAERDNFVKNSNYVLNLPGANTVSPWPSTTRISAALHLGRPLLGWKKMNHLLDNVVMDIGAKEDGEIVERLIKVSNEMDWSAEWTRQFMAYRTMFPMRELLFEAARKVGLKL